MWLPNHKNKKNYRLKRSLSVNVTFIVRSWTKPTVLCPTNNYDRVNGSMLFHWNDFLSAHLWRDYHRVRQWRPFSNGHPSTVYTSVAIASETCYLWSKPNLNVYAKYTMTKSMFSPVIMWKTLLIVIYLIFPVTYDLFYPVKPSDINIG